MVNLSILSDKHVTKTNGYIRKDDTQLCLNYKGDVRDKLIVMALSVLSDLKEKVHRYECNRIADLKYLVKKNKETKQTNPDS